MPQHFTSITTSQPSKFHGGIKLQTTGGTGATLNDYEEGSTADFKWTKVGKVITLTCITASPGYAIATATATTPITGTAIAALSNIAPSGSTKIVDVATQISAGGTLASGVLAITDDFKVRAKLIAGGNFTNTNAIVWPTNVSITYNLI
jgi:hypothetical protein